MIEIDHGDRVVIYDKKSEKRATVLEHVSGGPGSCFRVKIDDGPVIWIRPRHVLKLLKKAEHVAPDQDSAFAAFIKSFEENHGQI